MCSVRRVKLGGKIPPRQQLVGAQQAASRISARNRRVVTSKLRQLCSDQLA
jgi:hypothetical protein